jgi:hypothetical protein
LAEEETAEGVKVAAARARAAAAPEEAAEKEVAVGTCGWCVCVCE